MSDYWLFFSLWGGSRSLLHEVAIKMYFFPLILIFKIHNINVMISSLCYLLVSLLASLHLRELEGVLVPSLHTHKAISSMVSTAGGYGFTILGTTQIDTFF
jgi:hypothetical protein